MLELTHLPSIFVNFSGSWVFSPCPAAGAAVVTHLVLRPLIPIRGQAVGHHGPGPGHDGLGLDLGPPGCAGTGNGDLWAMGFTMGRSTEGMDVVTSFHRKPYGLNSSKSENFSPGFSLKPSLGVGQWPLILGVICWGNIGKYMEQHGPWLHLTNHE